MTEANVAQMDMDHECCPKYRSQVADWLPAVGTTTVRASRRTPYKGGADGLNAKDGPSCRGGCRVVLQRLCVTRCKAEAHLQVFVSGNGVLFRYTTGSIPLDKQAAGLKTVMLLTCRSSTFWSSTLQPSCSDLPGAAGAAPLSACC